MAFNALGTLRNVQGYLSASGYFANAIVGEPTQPPGHQGITAALFMDSVEVVGTTLSGTIERHSVGLRMYRNMLNDPEGDADTELDQAVAHIEEDLLGDFDLGATIRNLDADGLSVDWGYVNVGGIEFRVADMELSFIVDDSASFTK